MPDVIVTLRDRVIARVPVRSRETTVGRDATCDVTIDSPGISRLHAIVICGEHGYRVVDQESQNGIMLGDRKVREVELPFGRDDGVGLGKFRLQVVHAPGVGVPSADMAAVAAEAAKGGPRSVLSTVAIDDDAARKIHARLAAQKSAPPEAIHRNQRTVDRAREWLWWIALVLAAVFGAAVVSRIFL